MAAKPNRDEVLWTLHKGDRVAEARTSPDDGAPQLRIFTGSGPKRADYGQVSVQMARDAKALRDLADEKKKEFEAEGWVDA